MFEVGSLNIIMRISYFIDHDPFGIMTAFEKGKDFEREKIRVVGKTEARKNKGVLRTPCEPHSGSRSGAEGNACHELFDFSSR